MAKQTSEDLDTAEKRPLREGSAKGAGINVMLITFRTRI